MRNRWNVEKYPVIGWSAGLHEDRIGEVLRLGERYGVHRVLDAPGLDYDRDAEGRSYPEFLAGTTGGHALSAAGRVGALVAYVDLDGVVVQDEVADLGEVLACSRSMEQYHRPALELTLLRALVEEPTLTIASCSDIWLPWCSVDGDGEGDAGDAEGLADNRELAARHTPRLNAFLAGVAELARSGGGELRRDPDAVESRFADQVHDHGVRLEAGERP